MESILTSMNAVFDWFWTVHSLGGRYVAVVFTSILSAYLFMVLFKKFSNQKGISREKGKIIAYILEMRIYQDNLMRIMVNILLILKHNILYLRYALPPLAIMLIPLFIITMQVNNRCGFQPLIGGESFIVRTVFDTDKIGSIDPMLDTASVQTSAGLATETPVFRIPKEALAIWRIAVDPNASNGQEWIEILLKDNTVFRQEIAVGPGNIRFDQVTSRFKLPESLINNANGFLPPDSVVSSVYVQYHRQQYSFLGVSMDSIVLYFVLTLIFAIAIKPIVKVKI